MVTETRPAVERWERRTEIPLMLLALAFLVAYAWPVLDPRINPDLRTFLSVVSWTVWAAFALDFAIRLFLAHDRKRYAAKHWYDVALVVLPMLRPLRLLRLLALMRSWTARRHATSPGGCWCTCPGLRRSPCSSGSRRTRRRREGA